MPFLKNNQHRAKPLGDKPLDTKPVSFKPRLGQRRKVENHTGVGKKNLEIILIR